MLASAISLGYRHAAIASIGGRWSAPPSSNLAKLAAKLLHRVATIAAAAVLGN
jgi:hypothetical protein